MEFDYNHIDDHHKAVLCAFCLSPELISRGCHQSNLPTNAKKASSATLSSGSVLSNQLSGLVVGLGGGSIGMSLQRYLPSARLTIVELDPDMENIAANYFGFKKTSKTNVVVAEGMQYISTLLETNSTNSNLAKLTLQATEVPAVEDATELKSKQLQDFIFIDVDSKDPALALSAPPAAFITVESLRAMLKIIRPGGLLALNVVARGGPRLIMQLVETLKRAGQPTNVDDIAETYRYFTIDASEDSVNVVVVVVKELPIVVAATATAAATTTAGAGASGKKSNTKSATTVVSSDARIRILRESAIENWVQVNN